MNTNKLVGFLAAMVLALLAAESAEAFYHAGMGRFLNRDPSGQLDFSRIATPRPMSPGRFVSRDPMQRPPSIANSAGSTYVDGYNLYQYTRSNPGLYTDPEGLKCKIALRCNNLEFLGVAYGSHCGLVVSDDSGDSSYDGSPGDTNTIINDSPPRTAGTTTGFGNFPNSTCKCLKSEMARWNAMKIPRNSLGNNSNWTLKCLTKKCGIKLNFSSNPLSEMAKPMGFDGWWETGPTVAVDTGNCVSFDPTQECP